MAIVWVPIGLALTVIAAPLWLLMSLVSLLRGDDGNWAVFVALPLMGLSMYSELTGLISDPLDRFI